MTTATGTKRRTNKRTHLQLIIGVLRDALRPLTVREIVEQLDNRHPGWTDAKTYPDDPLKGRVGIVNSRTSCSCFDYIHPPLERIDEGDGVVRWQLTPAGLRW
jgi:hypothetical protein